MLRVKLKMLKSAGSLPAAQLRKGSHSASCSSQSCSSPESSSLKVNLGAGEELAPGVKIASNRRELWGRQEGVEMLDVSLGVLDSNFGGVLCESISRAVLYTDDRDELDDDRLKMPEFRRDP